jgi:sugar phosphate permease
MRRLMLVNWMLAAAWDVHSFAVPVLGHERGFAASTIGFVLGAFTAAITLVRLMVPFVAHRISETAVLGGAMVGVALAFVVYPLAPTALAMGGCAVLLGLALGGVQPMIMNVLHLLTPTDRQGEALGLRSMSINLSSSIMPLLFGAVGTAAGPAVLFWLVGALVGGGSLTVRGLGPVLRDARRREAELDRPAEPEPGPEPGQNPATDSSRVRT